ncbi:MAG: hypothetical protein JKY24_03245 [Pseudomonadales bacterium]|nr:hypothetical protein [Pseudomonadales bacterium]
MENIYETPKSDVLLEEGELVNNSGRKENVFPEGVKGWSLPGKKRVGQP